MKFHDRMTSMVYNGFWRIQRRIKYFLSDMMYYARFWGYMLTHPGAYQAHKKALFTNTITTVTLDDACIRRLLHRAADGSPISGYNPASENLKRGVHSSAGARVFQKV